MDASQFNPGFRLSLFDVVILLVGLIGGTVLGIQIWWAGLIVCVVVLHFFLFCNIFRISRRSEQIWAFAFVSLAGATLLTGIPGWITTMICAVVVSSLLVWRETRRKDYHGVCWGKWNPSLPDWWEARNRTAQDDSGEAGRSTAGKARSK